MADEYLLSTLSTFEAAAPALLVRSPARLVICEFTPETSVGIREVTESIFERTEEGAPVIRLASELMPPITLVAAPASEVISLLTLRESVRYQCLRHTHVKREGRKTYPPCALAALAAKKAARRNLNCIVGVVAVGLA